MPKKQMGKMPMSGKEMASMKQMSVQEFKKMNCKKKH